MAKHLIIPVLLVGSFVGSFVVLTTTEANAVVCARGVYRAGCVSAGGVVRPVVSPSRYGSGFIAGFGADRRADIPSLLFPC
jgi:hypothetical protein